MKKEFKITPEDVSFYKENGWWVSPTIIEETEIDNLLYAIERYSVGEVDQQLPANLLPQWSGVKDRGVWQADYLSLQMNEVMSFVLEPVIPRIAAMLCITNEIRLFHDQLVWKEPVKDCEAKSSVGWHTDKAYWQTCSSDNMLTAWIPLQDTKSNMGPLAVWSGSHNWRDTDHLHTFSDENLCSAVKEFEGTGQKIELRTLPMKKGQVSFHHCRLVHGSHPNYSEEPRLGFAIHYQDSSNMHINALDESDSTATHLNDVICRKLSNGAPDYSDPDICPVLWKAD